MSSPLVSIIIPCFNGEKLVADAIRSALAQTYENKEIIVVDDGSSDGSLSVIRSFGDRVRVVTGRNQGGSAARNEGLKVARGGLIQFLDADDQLHPEKLAEQVPVLQKSDATMVYSDWQEWDINNPQRVLQFQVIPSSDNPILVALQFQNIQTNASIHRKETLEKIGGFRTDLPCCQERDLVLRLACAGARFHHLPKVLHTVRRCPDSVSSDQLKVLRWMRTLLMDQYRELSHLGKLTPEVSRAFAALLARQGRALIRHGECELAREYYREALQIHPAGVAGAYQPAGYLLCRSLGPVLAERILHKWKRWINA